MFVLSDARLFATRTGRVISTVSDRGCDRTIRHARRRAGHARTRRSVVTIALIRARTPKDASGFRARVLAVIDRDDTIHEHPLDAAWKLHRALIRRAIL